MFKNFKSKYTMALLNRLTVLFFSSLLLVSCVADETDDLVDARDQFLGNWNVSESCSKDAYSVSITKDPSNSSQVLIQNFWNTGNCSNYPYAIVAGNSLFIPKQDICDNAFEVDGNGSMSKETITWDYSVNDGADLFNCVATYTRP